MGRTTRITISLGDGQAPIAFEVGNEFQALAMRWSYVARNRDRWHSGVDPGESDRGPLQPYLTAEQVDRIARAGLAEVGIPASDDEAAGWALRVFPWEYALSAATRTRRMGPLTVIRHLQGRRTGPVRAADLSRPATVESAPVGLHEWYDTRAEGDLMLSSLGADPAKAPRLRDPTRALLRQFVQKHKPTVLHLAGVDSHQALALLGLAGALPAKEVRDGYALRGDEAEPLDLVGADDLAALACDPAPTLVVCNLYNSASRIAARCVARGASFAVGYHDSIDDGLAAIFCSTLYRQLALNGGLMLDAFQVAMQELRAQPNRLRGACIVLWSATSLLGAAAAVRKGRPSRRALEDVPPWQRIRVECKLKPRLNYSLLHNRQSLFSGLQIYRDKGQGPIRDIEVQVDLNAGEASFPYRTTLSLAEGEHAHDLTQKVVIPLTSALMRTQSERIQSSLHLRVTCEGEVVRQDTFRVGLSPVDEWQDGEQDEWRWLPSFVLPRDPAVARIIDSAQGVLCALADDPTAGFDGYQSVDPEAESDAERYGCVDKQVQAIWYAILNSHGLAYINPPPSYGYATQRLRTPSQLLAERRGTCIDLALLLAACLEYVEIHPVIYLLTGHAFVGYWRSQEQYDAFLQMKDVALMFGDGADEAEGVAAPVAGSADNPGYVLTRDQHREVRQCVWRRELVAIEATWLTSRGAFESAVIEGRNNLRRASEFQAMIDVHLARDRGVTPLPLVASHALAVRPTEGGR